ncbi:MAG: plasmid recombination protein [Methylotenera sp.]
MYQFIHIETYAETVSKKAINRRKQDNKTGKQKTGTKSLLNVRQIIAEAKREDGAHPHVENPLKPINVYGISLDDVERLAIDSKIGQKDSMGRKLRNDTPILLAGIASYPRDEFNNSQEKFNLWLRDNINWLKEVYGNNLKNITLHLDEEHPHIHFYAISATGNVKDIHHGYKAEGLLVSKTDSKSKKLAYSDAMREFQNQYFLEVASNHSMLRTGPKLQRKSRSAYNADKTNAKLLAQKISDVDYIETEALKIAKDKSRSIYKLVKNQIENMYSNALKEIKRMQENAAEWNKNATENWRRLNEAEDKATKLDAELKTTKQELAYFVEENRELARQLAVKGKRNTQF